MESLLLNLSSLSAGVDAFKKNASGAFLELQAVAAATTGLMSGSFSALAQEANLSFSNASLGMQESFDMAFNSMAEGAAGLWLSISESTTEFCSGLNESFNALWLELSEGFAGTWVSIGEGTAEFCNELTENFAEVWAGLEKGFTGTWVSIGEGIAVFCS